MAKLPYLVQGMSLRATGFEIYAIVKSRECGNDAFCHPLQIAITDSLELRRHGFIAIVPHHLAQDQNKATLNSQDGYPPKLNVHVIDGESTHEGRSMEVMNMHPQGVEL